ncbi:MAG: anti-sigma factor family protein [Anaerolineae bacterium]
MRGFRGADHRFIRENMSAYIDSRLNDRDRRRFERHLAVCSECTANLAAMRQTKALLSQLPRVSIPHAFTLPASVEAERVRYQRLSRSSAWLGQASAIVAALLVVLFIGSAALSFLGAGSGTRSSSPIAFGAPAASTSGQAESAPNAAPTEPAYPAKGGGAGLQSVPAYPAATAAPLTAPKLAPQATPSGDQADRSIAAEAAPSATPEPPAGKGLGAAPPEGSKQAYPGAAPTNTPSGEEYGEPTAEETNQVNIALGSNAQETPESTLPAAVNNESISQIRPPLSAYQVLVRIIIPVTAGVLALLVGAWAWFNTRRKRIH